METLYHIYEEANYNFYLARKAVDKQTDPQTKLTKIPNLE